MVTPNLLKWLAFEFLARRKRDNPHGVSNLATAIAIWCRLVPESLVVLHFDPTEALRSGRICVLDVDVERRSIPGVPRIPSTGRVLELDPGNASSPTCGQIAEDARRKIQVLLQLTEEVKTQRLARKQIVEDAGLSVQLAFAASVIEYFPTDHSSDCLVQVVEQFVLCIGHRQSGTQSTASMFTYGQASLFAPECLEQAGTALERVVARN